MGRLLLAVDSRVRLSPIDRADPVWSRLRAEFTHSNPDYFKFKKMNLRAKPPPRTYETWRDEGPDEMSFPRGGLRRVREILSESGLSFDVVDGREPGQARDLAGQIPPHRVALRPYQLDHRARCLADQTALVRASAGSGKTTTALAVVSAVNLPTCVVVPSANLLDQWVDRCVRELGVPRDWVGVLGSGRKRVAPITVAMQQTLVNHVDAVQHLFGCLVVDEVHKAAASTFVRVVDKFAAKYRLGFSDDERRSDRKEFLIYDLFGKVAAEVDHQDLVDEGYVLDVGVDVVPTEFDVDWYHDLDPTQRAMAMDRVLDLMCNDAARNQLIIDAARDAADYEQCLVLSDRREHVRFLDRAIPYESDVHGVRSGFILGGAEDRVESRRTIERMRDGSLQVAVGTYQACGTGVDLPKVSHGVFATPVANHRSGRSAWKQYRGRYARPSTGKGRAAITYLYDVRLFGSAPLRNLCSWQRDVRVLVGGEWVPGKKALKEIERAEEK